MVTIRTHRTASALARMQTDALSENRHTDEELIGAFVELRASDAFEELVRRHGPMVLGVCLRVLRHRQDAEDAFQATFLVLARKAGSISPRNAAANWLHGVALQTAIRARAITMKRRKRETSVPLVPEAGVREVWWDDVAAVLDEELEHLPGHYRAVVLLCDVEGRTRADTARHLGCPEGSVSSRLSRARALLARRLSRRGVAPPLGGLALLAGPSAAVAVPPALVKSTVEAARSLVAGPVPGASTSSAVTTLTEGVLKAMLITELKALALIAVFVGFLGLGGAIGLGRSAGQQPGKPVEEKRVDCPKNPEEHLQKEVDAAVENVKRAKKALDAAVKELHEADERLATAKRKGKPIEVKPVTGKLLRSDVAERTVHVEVYKEVTDPRAVLWGGIIGFCGDVYEIFPLVPQATVLQDHVPTKLVDLKNGAQVTLRLGRDGKSAESVTVDGGSVRGRFVSWNETRNTITVTVGAKNEPRVFHLLRETCVRGAAHVKDFKPGTPLLITRSVEDANTVIEIEAVAADEGRTDPQPNRPAKRE
ncbi:sigma-70 family rna polymerase sigma factor : RNA polymerase sigma factor, sigma-70 family OS=Singulisphaera acidiphila (strain ATCC BAA-1392 / DSM 18658 / VKM B-2454 / MOB10) GN=Sinac_6419 PE=4 SV=1: Sigma70_r2: Sigma70_r4_2 [Gemmata massiliana]|uniref:RNA polymerase sigma-70 region 2 domain-containing protein n=2 Tax=Gemmata massiliana TaxID=1210884 RepID=A0A6P2DHA6_9BACT|nr:sigma-70 family rna polymerase sigma factor : RNA polymerase sigma factor, sigma-70 family OS=Singulisphaera acidiphila (strain ATCC BAA-1392 / DSM 18658 / VKM B-2454 / MOB10) GN=Sinac_6419 PE=4 SV=1: Sigma70_r2: Sigma70_r4_2 [Gemmata massiliana]